MKEIRVAINGLGRIGRAFLRAAAKHAEIEVVAVNDLGDKAHLEYLLKYDSVYGRSDVSLAGIKYLSEKEPSKLPWGELGVDVVVEATGFFASTEKAQAHVDAGAKRVVITAPINEEKAQNTEAQNPSKTQNTGLKNTNKAETVLIGINEETLASCRISSNASCTTNAAAPVIAILDAVIGVEKAVLNTVHAYTATQSLVDSPAGKKGLREGRAAAVNIIPSSTGAAVAMTKAYPALAGKFDGISLRVPVLCGSITDITFIAKRETTREEVNEILRRAAGAARWKGIFTVAEDELVSSDIIGRPEASIVELSMTRVVGLPAAPNAAQAGGNLVKVLAWYDNEAGYASTLVAHVIKAGEQLK